MFGGTAAVRHAKVKGANIVIEGTIEHDCRLRGKSLHIRYKYSY